jgi:hypothetical protein
MISITSGECGMSSESNRNQTSGSHNAKRAETEPKSNAPTSVQHIEPTDGATAGDKQEEQHQALEKSAKNKQAEPHPETVAGQHATGSFTGERPSKGK